MAVESEVIYIPDLARILGRSESSIRSGLQIRASWIPKSFKMGSRICWLKSDVLQFLQDQRDGKIETTPKRVGRKRQTPPTLRDIRK